MQACIVRRSLLLLCTMGSLLALAWPPQSSDKAIVTVHLHSSRKPLSVMELSDPQPASMISPRNPCARDVPSTNLTRADLLVVIPGSLDRFELAKASRVWRQGVPTALIMDQGLHMLQDAAAVQEELSENLEFWGTSPDVPVTDPLKEKAGDFRAALAPFLANKTAAPNSYKWILYGDDDTFWFIDNVLIHLDQLDPDMPYLLSDNIWMKERASDMAMHPNPKAPRCLPCGYTDPLQGQVPDGSFNAPMGCPCSSASLCQADTNNVMYNHTNCGNPWPFVTHVPSPGYWYFIHGGAGAIMSRGLMELTTFERCQEFINGPMPRMSGDAMFTLTVWHMMGTAPTDPGYGFYRPHVQMMDPGWLSGSRTQRGPEDEGTYDGGNDPVGVIRRFQQALDGDVDDQTCEQLDNVLTVHFRGRYAAVDVTSLSPELANQSIGTNNFKATAHLHRHMAQVYHHYGKFLVK
ncbi:hypothetical protein ABBQ32_007200 [Trebouxia sp. C0010 RCD-2024]